MMKKDLIKAVSEKSGFSQKDVNACVTSLLEVVEETLAVGEDITLTGFGKFEVVKTEERTCRNPITGGAVTVPPKNRVKFRVGKKLKDKVNE